MAIIKTLARFFHSPSAPGIVLILSAVFALLIYNSPLAVLYKDWLATTAMIQLGDFSIAKPLRLWIDDGLMMIFFLLVGLELKKEFFQGELKDPKHIILPGFAAFGGMLIPALIFIGFNYQDADNLQGWAIPSATDIAFALGMLSLLGNRVPISLKVFLTALAILDDIGAIIIIALFYNHGISTTALIISGVLIVVLFILNHLNVKNLMTYMVVGALLWVAMIESGVHATLAGVLIAFAIPINVPLKEHEATPVDRLEHELKPWVNFVILPVFAFANAGVALSGMGSDVFNTVFWGIVLGLFVGKQVGVFLFSVLAIKIGWAKLPTNTNWLQLYGVSLLAGIGFTMSLFIGSLAFGHGHPEIMDSVRLGILVSTLFSAIMGLFILYISTKKPIEKI